MTPAISARGLSKAYRVYPHPRDMMIEALTGRRRHQDFLALDQVSFEVGAGEVVGLMGRNGAGKSTLLRIIAGTLDATGGDVETRGRISAILELGTGFHLDYSGRENVYLGGLCLGLSRAEIARRFDEIVAFSEIGEFIDRPFRTYSSGMQARLTFSLATCVDPDILIIDEALSVGDARFQLKSFDRVREFKRRGKSILVVSHSINQIATICDRAILLERGRVLADGDPNKVGQIYHELLFSHAATPSAPAQDSDPSEPPSEPPAEVQTDAPGATAALSSLSASTGAREHSYGDRRVRITEIRICDAAGVPVTRLISSEAYWIEATMEAADEADDLCFGILLRDSRGVDLFGCDSTLAQDPLVLPVLHRGSRMTVRAGIRANLAAGTYFLTAAVARYDGTKHDIRFDAVEFVVAQTPLLYSTSVVNLEPEFSLVGVEAPLVAEEAGPRPLSGVR